MMKSALLYLPILALMIFLASCDSTPVVGSEEVDVLEDASFVVDSTYVVDSQFYAMGKITNTGKERFSPIWYVEGSFFTDAGESVKLGGNNTSFSFALEAGQTTIWVLKYRNSNLDPENYPDFVVSELRAFKELEE